MEASSNLNSSVVVKTDVMQVNHKDSLYTSDIWVGNPPQKLRALFDTGSQNTWILSKKTKLDSKSKSRFHNYYDESKSSSAKIFESEKKAEAHYGSGLLKGHFITDDIRLGLVDNSVTLAQTSNHYEEQHTLHIPNFEIGIIDEQDGIFDSFDFDAIVGLTYMYKDSGVRPFVDQLIQKKFLK